MLTSINTVGTSLKRSCHTHVDARRPRAYNMTKLWNQASSTLSENPVSLTLKWSKALTSSSQFSNNLDSYKWSPDAILQAGGIVITRVCLLFVCLFVRWLRSLWFLENHKSFNLARMISICDKFHYWLFGGQGQSSRSKLPYWKSSNGRPWFEVSLPNLAVQEILGYPKTSNWYNFQ